MIDKLQIIYRFTKTISVQIFLQEWLSKTLFTRNYQKNWELLLFTWIFRVYIDLCVAVLFSNSLECDTPQNMVWHTTECCMARTCTLWDASPFSSESWRGRPCSAAWSCCPARWSAWLQQGNALLLTGEECPKQGGPLWVDRTGLCHTPPAALSSGLSWTPGKWWPVLLIVNYIFGELEIM